MVVEQVEANEEKRKCNGILRFGLDIHTTQELSESQDIIDVDIFEGAKDSSTKDCQGQSNKMPMSNGHISQGEDGEVGTDGESSQVIEIDFRVNVEIPLSGHKLLVAQKDNI